MHFHFGTTNPFKVRELAAILRPLGVGLEVTDPIDPEETGETLEQNADIKAFAYGQYVGQMLAERLVHQTNCSMDEAQIAIRLEGNLVICEDSGITIPALSGLPGPWSARFDDCTIEKHRVVGHQSSGRSREDIDVANTALVLRLMHEVKQPHRVALFGVCLAVADTAGKVLFRTSSEVTGWVVEQPRGEHGFGYDSIFANGASFGHTWAEIDSMRKNLISHRRRALQAFTSWLATQLKEHDR